MGWLKIRRIDQRSLSLQLVQSPRFSDSGQLLRSAEPCPHPSRPSEGGQQVHCRGMVVKTVSKMSLTDEFVCVPMDGCSIFGRSKSGLRHEFRSLGILDGCFDTVLTTIPLQ